MDGVRQYLWLNSQDADVYAQFQETFSWQGGAVALEITADYQFAAYVNGQLAANSQYADYPDWKAISRYDITGLCRPGENTLTVKAYHPGWEAFQCRKMMAAVSFAVFSEDAVLAVSRESTLCRRDTAYEAGDLISPQLGLGYRYDFTAQPDPWERATVVYPGFTEVEKPIRNTRLQQRPAKPVVYGSYQLDGGETAAEKMLRAWQKPLDSMLDLPVTVQDASGDGVYILCDLGGESAGYPYFCLECQEPATAYLGWGEHLADGRIRTQIEMRNFAVTVLLKAGKNDFSDYLRRIGGRYLCLYVNSRRPVKLERIGLFEEQYPFCIRKKDFGDQLLNRLYKAGQRTLALCAHQHYEDCPWREQALYGMDSRNQMLFGYGAFGEYQFPRANLLLLAKGLAEDGLLHLCPPASTTITIPSFSAYWVLACYENARTDYCAPFVREVLPAIRRVMGVFQAQTRGNVVYTLQGERYWNFHEWSEGLDDRDYRQKADCPPVPDCPLTAICCRAAEAAAKLEAMAGDAGKSREYQDYAHTLAAGFDRFYVPEKGLFASHIQDSTPQGFHEFTQALLLSTGRLPDEQRKRIAAALQTQGELVPITLSGMALKYEGLLKYAEAKDYVLADMVRCFAPMLEISDTYWETALGQRDFNNAGSLCHGWSAVACYVLDHLQIKNACC